MARWRLTEPHYLNVEGIEWERVETHQESGKQIRIRHKVPLYLDLKDAGIVAEYGQNGQLIVSDGKGSQPRDIIFSGPPTPAMEPLDDEAEAITAAAKSGWSHPIESLPGQGFGENLLEQLSKTLADAIAQRPVAPVPGVDPEEFAQMKEQLAALMKQNAELKATRRI